MGAKSSTVLRRYLGLVSGMEREGNSGFREMLKSLFQGNVKTSEEMGTVEGVCFGG